jgi:two-component system copper resistance phosphate regulon response regulator CusR
MRVLIIEDEPDVADLLKRAMHEATWAADVASSGRAGLEALAVHDYDLAVLDVGLPDMSGIDVCREWRARDGATPILMLTARGALSDRVSGLDAGADDYLTKPFAIEELMARLRALARRPPTPLETELAFHDLVLDPARRTVHRGGAPISLTAREFALLEFFLRHARRVVTRLQILENVWDDNFDPVANAVDELVGRVRRKIHRDGLRPMIHTVRTVGYILSEEEPGAG